jgi:hypothetical protein
VHLAASRAEDATWRLTGGARPHVVDQAGRCDCADFVMRHTDCKHVLAVRLAHGDAEVLAALRQLVPLPKRSPPRQRRLESPLRHPESSQ